jgi:hypothetical protein
VGKYAAESPGFGSANQAQAEGRTRALGMRVAPVTLSSAVVGFLAVFGGTLISGVLSALSGSLELPWRRQTCLTLILLVTTE